MTIINRILTTCILLGYQFAHAQPRPKPTITPAPKAQPTAISNTTWTIQIPPKDTTSKAKAQINGFWKQIEKMHNHTDASNKQVVFSSAIQSAKSALNNTKMKDPAYNTLEMEKALAECEGVYNGIASSKEDTRTANIVTLKKMQVFFETGYKNLVTYEFNSIESDAEKIQRVRNNDDSLKKYKSMAEQFAMEDKDPTIYNDRLVSIKNVAKSFQAPYNSQEKWPPGLGNMRLLEDPTNSWGLGTFTLIQEVKRWEAYFYAAKVIYPNIPEIEKAYEWCTKAVKQIGTTDDVLLKINKINSDYLKSVKLPSAKVNDPALEGDFKRLFNEMGYKETIVKVNIQSTDWVIDRNELTSVIIGRSKQAYIATKAADGTCYITEFWIFQDYNGSGYGNFRNVTANSFRSATDCSNIQ